MPGVFVLNDTNTLVSLEAAHFASEDDFQVLLAKFPELLAGDKSTRPILVAGCWSGGKLPFPRKKTAEEGGRLIIFFSIRTECLHWLRLSARRTPELDGKLSAKCSTMPQIALLLARR